MAYTRPKTANHPSTNRARRGLTSFTRRTPLTHAANQAVCLLTRGLEYRRVWSGRQAVGRAGVVSGSERRRPGVVRRRSLGRRRVQHGRHRRRRGSVDGRGDHVDERQTRHAAAARSAVVARVVVDVVVERGRHQFVEGRRRRRGDVVVADGSMQRPDGPHLPQTQRNGADVDVFGDDDRRRTAFDDCPELQPTQLQPYRHAHTHTLCPGLPG